MNNKLFALWGEESRSSDSSPKLYEYLYKQFNVNGNNIIWDGYYSPPSLSTDENLKKLLLNCITEDRITFDIKDRFYHSIGKAASEYVNYSSLKLRSLLLVSPSTREWSFIEPQRLAG